MQRSVWGVLLIVVVALAGCGGGGGGTTGIQTPSLLSTVPDDIAGTYEVESLGLPNDEIVVETDGDVLIEVPEAQTLSADDTNLVKIGTCDSSGTLNLDGAWTVGGVHYSINATGAIYPNQQAIALTATVIEGNSVLHQNAAFNGNKAGATSDDVVDDNDLPPPPPDMGDDEDIEGPPPPPVFD